MRPRRSNSNMYIITIMQYLQFKSACNNISTHPLVPPACKQYDTKSPNSRKKQLEEIYFRLCHASSFHLFVQSIGPLSCLLVAKYEGEDMEESEGSTDTTLNF